MANLPTRLHPLRSTAERILLLSGSAGASVGVLHKGEVIVTENLGFRDHALQEQATADTLYNIGSLTKSMLAQAASAVVEEGLVSWDTPVSSIVPEFQSIDETLTKDCTLIDLLSHRSGLPTANVLWYQGGSEPLVKKRDLLPIINAMSPSFSLRGSWRYSNWGYALAGEMLERVTGEPWQVLLKKNLWEPLGLQRTTTDGRWKELPNVAQAFMALEDTSVFPLEGQAIDDSTVVGASGGVCSSVNELLLYYRELMRAYNHQSKNTVTFTPGSAFKQVPSVFSAHAVFPHPSAPAYADSTYTLGWVRTRLPSAVGLPSDNSGLVARMPEIGRGTKPQQVFYHQGTTAGFYSSVYLLPETESCVITLVNTKPLCDSSDWIAQLYLEGLIDSPEPIDFIKLTEESVRMNSSRFSDAEQTLSQERVLGTVPMALEAYCGRYYWGGRVYYIDIERQGEGLQLVIQGRADQRYGLQHYHYNTFTWLMTNDEEAKRGRFIQATYTYKMVFHCDEIQVIDGFTWQEIGGGKALFKKECAA